MTDRMERLRRSIINVIARRHHLLIYPDLLDALLELNSNLVEDVGEAVCRMQPEEMVVNLRHLMGDI